MKFDFKTRIFGLTAMLLLALLVVACNSGKNLSGNLTDTQKEASDDTESLNQAVGAYLSLTDQDDFAAAETLKIATRPSEVIYGDTKFGTSPEDTIYYLGAYDFVDEPAPASANPSLWRQSQLNRKHGLFAVRPGDIYQIRGFDLANMTFVRCDEQHHWIVIDPLGSPETAQAGMNLFKDNVDREIDVVAVIFTHSHIDHFGGIEGVGDDDYDVIGPEGFFEEAISENVMAGNCMGRRASYMYGNVLRKDAKGTLGTGLGQTTSTGIAGIRELDASIGGTTMLDTTIGGLQVQFLYTPDAEAPAEMMFYFPDYNAFCQSEELNHTLHNLYTLRGAKVRNGQKWSMYIDQAIELWGGEVEYSFGSHHWPTWGKEDIVKYWENQRDMYRFIHDQTLRLANNGDTPKELAEKITLPTAIDTHFYNRGYYGSVSHDVKAQYQLYFGWFDGVPANLNPLPPSEAGKKYVDLFLSKEVYLSKANDAYEAGDYRWAAEMLNHLVFGYPDYEPGRLLLADTYEQLGYQAESGPWRNFYLSGAAELRNGVPTDAATPATATVDMVKGMDNELFFNYLAMRFVGTNESAQEIDGKINITLTKEWPETSTADNQELSLIVSNGAVSPRIDRHLSAPNCEVLATRAFFVKVLTGQVENTDDLRGEEISISSGEAIFKNFIKEIEPMVFWFNISEP